MELITNRTCCNEIINYNKVKNSDNILAFLSVEGKKIFACVNFIAICDIVAIFGITANIINIIIFYKQGFSTTVNIAFLGLAISDLCSMIAMEWWSICVHPFLPVYEVTWIPVEVMYLSAGWLHICACRISNYIPVYITAERFISIALPLKVKELFTTQRTTIIIIIIYITNVMTLVPEYVTSYLGWRFIPEKINLLQVYYLPVADMK
jgi:hypothetical protein